MSQEIRFDVTLAENGYVLKTEVDTGYFSSRELREEISKLSGTSIHDDVVSLTDKIEKVIHGIDKAVNPPSPFNASPSFTSGSGSDGIPF